MKMTYGEQVSTLYLTESYVMHMQTVQMFNWNLHFQVQFQIYILSVYERL